MSISTETGGKMRIGKIIGILGIAVFIGGCVPSLHPLFTPRELFFEPTLVGSWVDEKEKDIWTFQSLGDSAYELTYIEKGISAKFEAHLVRFKEFMFLDTHPKEFDSTTNFYALIHWIPGHIFSRIWIERDTLRLAILDYDWLDSMLTQNKVTIACERVDSSIVLTACTKELQEFVIKYAEEAFSNPWELYRQTIR